MNNNKHILENSSEVLINVHDPAVCAGQSCTIHNRSDHHMRSFPQHWRSDRSIMERICPHGVGHPDPDERPTISFVHGCDGCCYSEMNHMIQKRITPDIVELLLSSPGPAMCYSCTEWGCTNAAGNSIYCAEHEEECDCDDECSCFCHQWDLRVQHAAEEIKKLRAENADILATIPHIVKGVQNGQAAEIHQLKTAGDALAAAYRKLGGLDVAYDTALTVWEVHRG